MGCCPDRGGKIIIPAFAIGRVEEVLYWLKTLEEQKRIPTLLVFVDSPMAAAALQFYSSRLEELDPEMKPVRKPASSIRCAPMPSPQPGMICSRGSCKSAFSAAA